MIKKILKYISFLVIPAYLCFYSSCANTTTPPSGGVKDTIPPIIVNIKPLPGSVNVKTNTDVVFTFNEYFKVKDPKNIYLSPPLSKAPKFKIRGKRLIVYFEEALKKNTTYSLDLTNAIVDNNEGNLFPGYTLVFSTGPKIDSMYISGTVMDAQSLEPIPNATVMLYKDQKDSAIVKHIPFASTKTDNWGYFVIRNIPDTLYRLYAIKDLNNNNRYDPQTEEIAFESKPIRPTLKVSNNVKELLKYDMKDTLNCLARKSEYELRMFKSKSSKQMIKGQNRIDAHKMYISFTSPSPEIDSIWAAGEKPNSLIFNMQKSKDSLLLWLNKRGPYQDTINVYIDYKKTDSLGKLKPDVELLKFYEERKNVLKRREKEKKDTSFKVNIAITDYKLDNDGFVFNFDNPIIKEKFDSLRLYAINPKQEQEKIKFKYWQDSTDVLQYHLMPVGGFKKAYQYKLKVPARVFEDVRGQYNDSTETQASLPSGDDLSSISLKLSGVDNKVYIVDLLSKDRRTVLRSYKVNKNSTIVFPYLKADDYSIRISQDLNNNGKFDVGNFFEHKQAEKVKFYKLRDNSYIIKLNKGIDLVQNINLEKMFEK